MSASSEGTSSLPTFDPNYKTAALNDQILVAAVVFFTVAVIFVLLLYIYTRRRLTGVTANGAFVDLEGPDEIAAATRDNGLDLDVIKSLPVLVFESEEFPDGIECAVCLSEVVDGEKARLLPNCNHGFHLECIDVWFCSHSTCPLCRDPLGAAQLECRSEATAADSSSPESASLPTNVLFWGNGSGEVQEAQTSTPTSSFRPPTDGMVVIEIPRRVTEVFDSNEETNAKIPTPISTRLGSFRRLFSREKRSMGFGCSSVPGGVIAVDVEQGR